MDINRLAQPKRSISKDRGAPDGGGSGFGGGLGGGGGGSLTRARSIQNLSPRTKTTHRSRQVIGIFKSLEIFYFRRELSK